jgi:hypothetical protein
MAASCSRWVLNRHLSERVGRRVWMGLLPVAAEFAVYLNDFESAMKYFPCWRLLYRAG